MGLQAFGYDAGKIVPVHRQRSSSRNLGLAGRGYNQRTQAAHLFLEYSNRCFQRIVAQGIGTNQLAEEAGPMRFGHARRAHFKKPHANAAARELPCCLAASETSSDYVYKISFQSERSQSYPTQDSHNYPLGSCRIRSPIMFFCTADVPPATVRAST